MQHIKHLSLVWITSEAVFSVESYNSPNWKCNMHKELHTHRTVDSSLLQNSYYYFDVHCIDCTSDASGPPSYPEISLLPNVTDGEITLSGNFPEGTLFEIYNMLGQRVYYNEIQSGNNLQTLFLTLADGTYTYRLQSDGVNLKSGKLVIAH